MKSIIERDRLSSTKSVRINVSVPEWLHKKFKMKAVINGESHQDIIIRAIEEYVNGE